MPLEIRELVIRAAVSAESEQRVNQNKVGDATEKKQADVNLIVEKVLEILEERAGR